MALLSCSCQNLSLPWSKKEEKPAIQDLKKSVVKIFSTVQSVDFYEPWKPGSETRLEGCGTVVAGQRILTTGHLIHKATYIEVQKFGETKRYVAKLAQDGYDTDLALLTVDDPDFFKDAVPVEFGEIPQPGDKLTIQGGDDLSIKEDTVSALDMVWTYEGGCFVPGIITDSEIDPKYDGCPVFKDGKFVGIPFETWHQSKKAGSVLPVNMVQRFFKSIKDGRRYDGLPDLGVYAQDLENTGLRDYYGMAATQTGVVITQVLYGGASVGLLKEGDILAGIDGHSLDNEGYFTLGKGQRIQGDYLISFYLPGEEVALNIVREGKEQTVKVPLKTAPTLVSYRSDNRHPTYFMTAGFVFVPLTYNYLQSTTSGYNKPALQEFDAHGLPSPERREVVLMSHVLPHEINTGYDDFANFIVEKVNGKPIGDMKDLLAALQHPEGKDQVIEGDNHAWFGNLIVFNAKKAAQATQEIMQTYRISSDRSDDLK